MALTWSFRLLLVFLLSSAAVLGAAEDARAVAGGAPSNADAEIAEQHRLKKNYDFMTRWLSGLPLMPPNHSPDSEEWTNSIAICAIMRDENRDDVTEWLKYYKWLGVDHVFLTDNNSQDGGEMLSQLSEAFPATFLTVRSERQPKAQLKVYSWCAEEQRTKFNWLAFFDLDEYLVIRQGDKARPDLKGFLDQYRQNTGLSINWIAVGPSGHEKRPAGGGVLQHYRQCVTKVDRHIKTIANTWFLDGVALHPHNFHFRGGKGTINEHLQQLPEIWMPLPKNVQPDKWTGQQCTQAFQEDSPLLRIHCYKTAEPLLRNGTVDRVALFHFATKSAEDFKLKQERGSGMSQRSKGHEYFNEIKSKQTSDPLCQEPSQLYESCCGPNATPHALGDVSPSAVQRARKRHFGQAHQESGADGRADQALRRAEAEAEAESEGRKADYYLSVKYVTKHVQQKTVVQPGSIVADASVAKALMMLTSVLSVSFVVLVALLMLLWRGRYRSERKTSKSGCVRKQGSFLSSKV